MAKTNGWTKLLIGTAISLVAVGVAWGALRNKVGTMGEKGCDPAQKHTTEIAVIQNSLETIQDDISGIREEHKEGQRLILEAIKAEK